VTLEERKTGSCGVTADRRKCSRLGTVVTLFLRGRPLRIRGRARMRIPAPRRPGAVAIGAARLVTAGTAIHHPAGGQHTRAGGTHARAGGTHARVGGAHARAGGAGARVGGARARAAPARPPRGGDRRSDGAFGSLATRSSHRVPPLAQGWAAHVRRGGARAVGIAPIDGGGGGAVLNVGAGTEVGRKGQPFRGPSSRFQDGPCSMCREPRVA